MSLAAQDRLLTAEDLAALPDDEQRLELVAGVLVAEPPASWMLAFPSYALGSHLPLRNPG